MGFPSFSFRFDRSGHRAKSGGSEALMQVVRSLPQDSKVVGTRRASAWCAARLGHVVVASENIRL
jgi:hypothetical protein